MRHSSCPPVACPAPDALHRPAHFSWQALGNSFSRLGQHAKPHTSPALLICPAVVATNARFTKTEMNKIAQMASAGLARTINPVFTTWDGDTVFAASTRALASKTKFEVGAIGAIGAEALAEAILRAVRNAKGIPGIPAVRDLRPS